MEYICTYQGRLPQKGNLGTNPEKQINLKNVLNKKATCNKWHKKSKFPLDARRKTSISL